MSFKSSRPKVVLVNRAIILNKEKEILLIQRNDSKETWSANKWEFPGGKLDEGQDLSNALEREIFEETGLLVQPINRLAYYESFILTKGKYKGLPYIVLIGICKLSEGILKLSDEHKNAQWVNADEILNIETTLETKKALTQLKPLINSIN